MTYLRINGRNIFYDKKLPYLAIGVVGSGHGGEIYDRFQLDPKSCLGYKSANRTQISEEALKIGLSHDLSLMRKFLSTGVFEGGNGTVELDEEERPAFERSAELYNEVLAALKGK